MIYLDTSAFLKTMFDEPQSPAIRTYLEAVDFPRFVSSTLLAVEARRGALRAQFVTYIDFQIRLRDHIQGNTHLAAGSILTIPPATAVAMRIVILHNQARAAVGVRADPGSDRYLSLTGA